jgi:hypoxia up-regulated 1
LIIFIYSLLNLDSSELIKRRKDEARNSLEGYLYRLRDLLEGDPLSPFMNCSTEAERRKLEEKSSEIFSWMYEFGDEASTGELWEKKDSIEWV